MSVVHVDFLGARRDREAAYCDAVLTRLYHDVAGVLVTCPDCQGQGGRACLRAVDGEARRVRRVCDSCHGEGKLTAAQSNARRARLERARKTRTTWVTQEGHLATWGPDGSIEVYERQAGGGVTLREGCWERDGKPEGDHA